MNIINPLGAMNAPAPVTVAQVSREGREHHLRPYQIVHGSVAEGGQERVLLDLGQRQLWAETKTPLKTGQHLTLQVVATSPRLELRLVDDLLAERLGGFLHLLGEHWNIKPVLQALSEEDAIFGQLSIGAQNALTALLELQQQPAALFDGLMLKAFLRRLGLNLESRLGGGEDDGDVAATLKGALLEIHHLKTHGDSAAGKAAERLLKNLESFQLCQVRLGQQGALLLPLPLPFLDQGYLVIEEGQSGAEGEERGAARFSLHLSLKSLGDLRVDFLHESQGLYVRFVCDSQEKIDFISPFLEELKMALTAFPLKSVTFATDVEDPAKTLLRKILPEGDAMLDTRV